MTNTIVSAILILLAFLDWYAVAIVQWAWNRHSDVVGLKDQRNHFILQSLSATCIGAIALDYLTGHHLPPAADYLLLVVCLLLISAPCVYFLIGYYRR